AAADAIFVGSTTATSVMPSGDSTVSQINAALSVDAGTGNDARILLVQQNSHPFTATVTSGSGSSSGGWVTLSGAVVAGGAWTLRLVDSATSPAYDRSFTYVAKSTDTLYTVAAALAALV